MLPEKKEAGNRQEEMVSRTYELAEAAHQGKNDRGGHPYIGHPVRVSARFEADAVMQVAALLHDTVEDTPATLLARCEKEGDLPPFAEEARSALLNLILPPLCLQ